MEVAWPAKIMSNVAASEDTHGPLKDRQAKPTILSCGVGGGEGKRKSTKHLSEP